MKKFTFLFGLVLMAWFGYGQTTINYQDFEGAADDWNYTPNPAPYNVSGDTWDTVTDFNSHIAAAQNGTYFWGMRDLDNPNGGGPFRHTLSFDAIDVSSYSDVEISFYYYTDGYDGSDSIFYNVQYDNGSAWPIADDIELSKNTGTWTLVTVDVPAGTQYVRLQLSARQNGGSDYAGFDNVVLSYGNGGGGGGGTTADTAFYEPFDADLDVMTTQNIIGNDQEWVWTNYGNPPGSAKMNGYSGGAQDNEDWLITPAINLSGYSNVTLHFDHARNYGDNSGLYVLVSNDYDGVSDPNTSGTWNDVTAQFTFPDPGGWSFIDAGTVDISTYTGGTTYVAFKYTSTTAGAATWEVDNITVAGNPPPVYIVGSFQGWTPGDPDYEMTLNTNGVYVLTKNLPAADNEYKVVEGSSWSDPNYPGTNQHINLTVATDTTWRVNADADLVMHTLPVVAGDFFSAMNGTADWDPTNLTGQMTDADGDDIYTVELTVPSGNWQFKVALNNNWDQSTGGNVSFTSDGVNATTFTYDFSTNTTSVTGPPPPTATVTFIVYDTLGQNYDGFYLKGSWDVNGNYDPSWDSGNEHSAFYDDGTNGDAVAGDHIWTCQQDLVVDNGANTWEWGVNDSDHNWVAGNWQFTIPDTSAQTQSWEVPVSPALVINEIMYNSPGADEEWIELYNTTGSSIDLENWKVLDNDANHTPIIIPAGYSIAANGYFTIQITDNGNFPFTPDYDGSGNFGLGNGGDAVRLWNADGILVDIVNYDDSSPWPTEPDGDGPSLSLIDPSYDNSLPGSWLASDQDGGTPGALNFIPQPFIRVINPNGGESIEQGSVYTINWSYGNWDGNIEIDLFHGENDSSIIVYNLPASDSSFDWMVFNNQAIDTNYKIKIKGINAGDPADMSDNSFSIIEPYISPNLVITEIMYNPPESGEDTLEFIELYNNSADTANLNGVHFSEGVEFTFPDVDLLPESYVLVAKDSLAMLGTFGATAYQWTSGGLSNGGEDIVVLDLVDNVIDSLTYDDQAPWPTEPDGDGPSLTLCNPDLDNSLGENWHASVNLAAVNADGDSIYATPGFACQIQLIAAFQADTTIVLVGDSVQFTDMSTGNPTSWEWSFEGGTPATYSGQYPPAITYDTAGKFDVTLIISDGSLTDTAVYTDYIWAGEAPVADFDAMPTTVTVGSYANFTNLSTGEAVSYSWTFEGATPDTSTAVNPQEIYYLIPADSLYNVTLVATNVFGTDTLTKSDFIHTIPDGLSENRLAGRVVLYPNPSTGLVNITLPTNTNVEVSVINLVGRQVFSSDYTGSAKLSLSHLPKGVYLVKFTDKSTGEQAVKRLIIK